MSAKKVAPIADWEKTQAALRESEERFRLMVEGVRDYAIFMFDPKGRILSWNPGAERIYGYEESEIVGKSLDVFYPIDEIRADKPSRESRVALSEGRFEEEGERLRKDGSRFWASIVVTPLHDEKGKLRGFSKVTRDITERRRAEAALEELAGHLLKMQDEERRRVASELHDSTSPLLTTLIGKLYAAKQRSPALDPDTTRLLDESLTLAENTAGMLRSVSHLLHPPLLDEQGLVAGLRWYLSGFSSRTGIDVKTDFPERLKRLPRDVEIALFRAVQESLAFIIGASAVRHVDICLSVVRGLLTLQIGNDLLEKDSRALRSRSTKEVPVTGAGLSGTRQRIKQFGGHLEVLSSGARTWVTVTLPHDGRSKE
ncbi:MAG TPA: PAS domain S-box protein [Thermoanaerobaculia bacterium]|nr:PAS domain S-box protein [Thermoanaerobaculia bacterium]